MNVKVHKLFPSLLLLSIGLAVALILVLVFSIEGSDLSLLGYVISDSFAPERMHAAIFSFLTPFGFLLPFYAVSMKGEFPKIMIQAVLAPVILFLPSMMVWMLKSSFFDGSAIIGLLFVSFFILNLTMWLFLLRKRLEPSNLFVAWAGFWGLSEVLAYTHSYLVPNLSSPLFKVLDVLYVLVPPVSFMNTSIPLLMAGPPSLDTILHFEIWVLIFQSAVLFGLVYWKKEWRTFEA